MQKAWFYNEYGSIDVLQFGEFPVPKPGPGEILLKIRAAALNPVDYKKREGLFRSADCDFPAVPGCDAAGVVVEVGDGVSKLKIGDEVYSDIQHFTAGRPKQLRTLAQYTVVEESAKSHVVAKEEAKVLDIASFQPHPRAEFFLVSPSGHNLEKLQPYIESEKLKPVIDPKSPYSFSDVIEAFKHQESGRARGKIVISPIE
uniref:Enoyl reductase (ER) domain-containing protein n=1 Tax=Picea sitchensis TaxID=3332 RepID=A9NLT9_PICSI|nr:unknown [Picea sitchensis]